MSSLKSRFFQYVFFNILSMVGLSVYVIADTFFIANGLGARGLAALNLALPVFSFINGLGLMFGIGGATRFIISKTESDRKRSDLIFSTMIWAGMTVAAIVLVMGLFFSGDIAQKLGADATTYGMTEIYVRVECFFAPFFILNNTLSAFVKNDGNPTLAMVGMVAGCLFNIIFDYIFIFILGLGMFGAVLATGGAPVTGILILSSHFWRKKNTFSIRPWFSGKELSMALSGGIPSFVNEMSAGIVMFVFNNLILELSGNDGVAAYGILCNLLIVVAAVYNGLAQGAQPLMGEMYAMGKKRELRKVLQYAMFTSVLLSGFFYLVMVFGDRTLVDIFNREGNIYMREIAMKGFPLFFSQVLFLGFNTVLIMYYVSVGRAGLGQLMSLLKGLFIVIPLSILLASLIGLNGVWITMSITEALVCLLGVARCEPGSLWTLRTGGNRCD